MKFTRSWLRMTSPSEGKCPPTPDPWGFVFPKGMAVVHDKGLWELQVTVLKERGVLAPGY